MAVMMTDGCVKAVDDDAENTVAAKAETRRPVRAQRLSVHGARSRYSPVFEIGTEAGLGARDARRATQVCGTHHRLARDLPGASLESLSQSYLMTTALAWVHPYGMQQVMVEAGDERTWSLSTSCVMWMVSGGCCASTVPMCVLTAPGRLMDERLTLLDIFALICCERLRELSDVMNVFEYTASVKRQEASERGTAMR